MNKAGPAKPFVPPEPDRSHTGGPCYICKKTLITSLASSPLMTKATTREEKYHRDFLDKFMAKDMQSRTGSDMVLVNRAFPPIPAKEVIAMSCGHLFHRQCFKEYSDKYKIAKKGRLVTCPMCRERVLLGSAVTFDTRPLDCGLDQLPVPVCKEIKNLEKEGLTLIENLTKTRLNCHRGLTFYMEQMCKIKTFKHEIIDYYEPFWMNDKNIDALRERRDSLKKEANDREFDNIKHALNLLSSLEKDKRLTRMGRNCISQLRSSREGIDGFRAVVKALQKVHKNRFSGDTDIPALKAKLIQLLSNGFKFPSGSSNDE